MRFILPFAFFALLMCNSAIAQMDGEFNRSAYAKGIKKERLEKDKEMISDPKSPIPEEEKASFKKLNYYKPGVTFCKLATFERYDQATRFFMKTTTERLPEYSIYGSVTFRHKGKNYKLNVYQNIELVKKPGFEKHLFIPFNDETNGNETYGGGRFLDVYENGEDVLLIDFNKAYNPYCAYNHKYSCPIPPEANNLKIKIKAGEKKWHD
jgi:uncharacterized protein (DUF1684 family)